MLESASLVALFVLWLASGFGLRVRTPPFQRLHYQLVGWYLRMLYREATRVLRLRVEVEGPDPDEYLGRPLLVFCRHAGPGDSFLLIHALVNWYEREPRIVLRARCSGTRRSTSCSTGCRTGSSPAGRGRWSGRSASWPPRWTTTTRS